MNSLTNLKWSDSASIGRNWRTLAIMVLALPFLFGGSCIPDFRTPIEDWRTTTENLLNDALAALNNASADWQRILEELKEDLPEQVRSTVRVEVANLISRSIAQGGVELRCNLDFIRIRVRQALERIKIKFLGGTPSPTEPGICQVVPLAVDRALVPSRIKQIEFYGYDFDQASDLKVILERTNGRQDVTGSLNRPTHYAMTLSFGATGVQLDANSLRFTLEWGGRIISTIAIIQPTTPVCRTRTERIQPNPVTYVPPHQRGDREFEAHGPTIVSRTSLLIDSRSIRTLVYMLAYESNADNSGKEDYTKAEGSKIFPMYTAPSGWRILRVSPNAPIEHRFRDTDWTIDSYNMGGGIVRRLDYVGDIDGHESGTRTKVDVTFNQLIIDLVETENCVPANTVMELRGDNLIDDATFLRLKGSVEEQLQRRIEIIDVEPDTTRQR